MNAPQMERLGEHLQCLRLFKSRERLEALLQDASAREMSYADFLKHGENVVILGPPGVGKTYLAVGLGLKAIEHGTGALHHRSGHDRHRHPGPGTASRHHAQHPRRLLAPQGEPQGGAGPRRRAHPHPLTQQPRVEIFNDHNWGKLRDR